MLNAAPILHVEDNEDDQFFLRRAFAEAGIENKVHFVDDGQKAIDYLSSRDIYSDPLEYPTPCLVILDLKLPKVHGLDVLRWIRSQEKLRSLIVIILSSSPLRNDVDTAYKTGVNSFVVKPLTAQEMNELASLIRDYWLKTNEFPSVCEMAAQPD